MTKLALRQEDLTAAKLCYSEVGSRIRLARPHPLRLYHYTSGSAVIDIIKTDTLRATNITQLNDTSEFFHVLLQIDKMAKFFASRSLSELENFVIRRILTALNNTNNETASSIFVSCFTEERNQLGMWRAYSGGEGGYCLEFPFGRLQRWYQSASEIGNNSLYSEIWPCIYREDEQHEIIFGIIKHIATTFSSAVTQNRDLYCNEYCDMLIQEYANLLGFFCPAFKDASFSQEQEWRLIFYANEKSAHKIDFVAKRGFISSFIPLRNGKLPISEILIGPSPFQVLSKRSLETLLRNFGQADTSVNVAQSPYRHV